MSNLPDSFDVPIPHDASDEEVSALVDDAVDRVVNKAIDDDIDGMLGGFN